MLEVVRVTFGRSCFPSSPQAFLGVCCGTRPLSVVGIPWCWLSCRFAGLYPSVTFSHCGCWVCFWFGSFFMNAGLGWSFCWSRLSCCWWSLFRLEFGFFCPFPRGESELSTFHWSPVRSKWLWKKWLWLNPWFGPSAAWHPAQWGRTFSWGRTLQSGRWQLHHWQRECLLQFIHRLFNHTQARRLFPPPRHAPS